MLADDKFEKQHIGEYEKIWKTNRDMFTTDYIMWVRKGKLRYYILLFTMVVVIILVGFCCSYPDIKNNVVAFGLSILAGVITALFLEISDNIGEVSIRIERYNFDLVRVYGLGHQLINGHLKACCDSKGDVAVIQSFAMDLLDDLEKYERELECFWKDYFFSMNSDLQTKIKGLSFETDQCKSFAKHIMKCNEFNHDWFDTYRDRLNKILSDRFLLSNYVLRLNMNTHK